MPAKGAVEIGQIGETCFGGDVCDLAMAPSRVAQQRGSLFEAPIQHVMGEALAGFFEEKMDVARSNAKLGGDEANR